MLETGSVTAEQPSGGLGGGPHEGGRELDLLVAGAALVVSVCYVPVLDQGATTVRLAIVLPVGAVGLVLAALLARRGDVPTRFALGYLVWAGVSSLAAPNVARAVLPGFGSDRGWVVAAACIGWYVIGRLRGEVGARLLRWGLLLGLAINAFVAVAQYLVDGPGVLALSQRRALGLTPSPVYLATLLAGALGLAAWMVARDPQWRRWLPVLVLFAMATEASGGRGGLIAGTGVAIVLGWGAGWRRLAVIVATIVAGVVLLAPFGSVGATSDRLADREAGGVAPRLEMWGHGLATAAERPITGWGPDHFLAVTGPRISASFARAEGPDRRFFDAHNIVVEQLVSTGLPGVVALGGFAIAATRRARGPLGAFAAGASLTWLVEPVSISTLPLVLVALGAATVEAPRARVTRRWAVAATVAGLVAVVLCGRLVFTDVLVARSKDHPDLASLERAHALLPRDPVVADLVTQEQIRLATVDPAHGSDEAVAAARRTIDLEPDDPKWWFRLAEAQASALHEPFSSDPEGLRSIERTLLEAYELNPWSERTLLALANVSEVLGDDAAHERWEAKRCQVVDCP